MPEVILPCPACGGNDLGCWEFVVCKDCEMRGPSDVDESAAIAAWNALPRALTWTHEPPQVPGRYWWRDVSHKGEATTLYMSQPQVERLKTYPGEEWAGPISPPID